MSVIDHWPIPVVTISFRVSQVQRLDTSEQGLSIGMARVLSLTYISQRENEMTVEQAVESLKSLFKMFNKDEINILRAKNVIEDYRKTLHALIESGWNQEASEILIRLESLITNMVVNKTKRSEPQFDELVRVFVGAFTPDINKFHMFLGKNSETNALVINSLSKGKSYINLAGILRLHEVIKSLVKNNQPGNAKNLLSVALDEKNRKRLLYAGSQLYGQLMEYLANNDETMSQFVENIIYMFDRNHIEPALPNYSETKLFAWAKMLYERGRVAEARVLIDTAVQQEHLGCGYVIVLAKYDAEAISRKTFSHFMTKTFSGQMGDEWQHLVKLRPDLAMNKGITHINKLAIKNIPFVFGNYFNNLKKGDPDPKMILFIKSVICRCLDKTEDHDSLLIRLRESGVPPSVIVQNRLAAKAMLDHDLSL